MSKHIELPRLDSRTFACTVTTDGVAQPLGSCYITFTVKEKYSYTDGQALFQLTIGNGGISFTDTTSGKYDLIIGSTLTSSVTKTDKNVNYVFDHKIQLPSGSIKTLEEGAFVVKPSVTDTVS